MNAVIEQITPYHPQARALLRAAAEASEALYPPTSQHGIDLDEAAKGVMLVAWVEGEAVGCGLLRPLDHKIAEVKRLFVTAERRGQGLAKALMAELEAVAVRLGHQAIRLETGRLQPEAIALYERIGYAHIPCFGEYADDPMSVCLEKRLASSDPE